MPDSPGGTLKVHRPHRARPGRVNASASITGRSDHSQVQAVEPGNAEQFAVDDFAAPTARACSQEGLQEI
jgi:hypothetical protein